MALVAAEIDKMPITACVGVIKSVEKLRVGKEGNSVYHVVDLVIEPQAAPSNRDYRAYLTFRPEWFDPNFQVPQDFEYDYEKLVFQGSVAFKGRRKGILQGILGDSGLGVLEVENPTAEDVLAQLQKHLIGRQVGFTLVQQKEKNEETGQKELTENISVGGFFGPDSVAYFEGRQEKDDSEYVCAWEPSSNPLG